MNKILEILKSLLTAFLSKPTSSPPTVAPVPTVTFASPPKLNEAGKALIKSFEGCELSAYLDVVGIPTIGYGHTGPEVVLGLTWTQAEVDAAFEADIARFCKGVTQLVRFDHLTDNQFSALVSFSYNLGLGNLQKSTLLKKLNAGDVLGASEEFVKWNKAGGVTLPGLTRRREAEKALFLS